MWPSALIIWQGICLCSSVTDSWTSLSASGKEFLLVEAPRRIGISAGSPESWRPLLSPALDLPSSGSGESTMLFDVVCVFWFDGVSLACDNT